MEFNLYSDKIIVADVGGTNGRFAIVHLPATGVPSIVAKKTYKCASFDSFTEMFRTFIIDHSVEDVMSAQIALAGQTSETEGHITNIGWHIDAADLQRETGLQSIVFMNDFAAVASAIPYMKEGGFEVIKPGKICETAPISTMGPGTGFGVAQLIPVNGTYKIVPTEGGHIAFAPATQLEQDLLTHLKKSSDHVCVESLLSGRGLVRIHDFLVEYAGSGQAGLGPAEITHEAAVERTPSCVRAVQVFLSVLGGTAGDIALVHGARGGVWIAGGIVPKIFDLVGKSDLVSRFSMKGIMSPYLTDIPINLVTDTDAALIGAAAAWKKTQCGDK